MGGGGKAKNLTKCDMGGGGKKVKNLFEQVILE